jgi:hypothetical protein
MQKAAIYIRILTDQIPEQQREKLAFREDRNYLVIAIDPEKTACSCPMTTTEWCGCPWESFDL